MSYYDGLAPNYTFSLRIERNDRVIIATTLESKATAEEVAKAKKTIQRLLNEYTPAVVPAAPTQDPEQAPSIPEPDVSAQAPAADQPEEPAEVTPAPDSKPAEGARGLLRLYCRECGNIFGTYLKERRSEMLCRCGHSIDLTVPLARYRFTCPYCEKEAWGQTNLEEPEITVRCKCGRDINLEWVSKVREYRN